MNVPHPLASTLLTAPVAGCVQVPRPIRLPVRLAPEDEAQLREILAPLFGEDSREG